MRTVTRRAMLVAAGGGLAVSLSGCSEDPEPGLHAVNAIVRSRGGGGEEGYPADVTVRATVENTDLDRHTGVLAVTLTRADGDGEWTRERDVDLSGGTSISYLVDFEDVVESDDDVFDASATIRTTGS